MEGEPLSHKDQQLLQINPALVVEGLEILAHALRARRTIIAVGNQIATERLRQVISDRRSEVEVNTFPDTFVAGQESALVNRINGGSAVPSDPLRAVWQAGVDNRPTMISNAESLAQIALIVRFGADWFRSAGTEDDPGTFLISLSGTSMDVLDRTVVAEVERGALLGKILEKAGARLDLIGGVLVGGYHGAWLPATALDTPLSRKALAPWGAAPGAGVLRVLDRRHCPLRVAAEITEYLAGQSARQCGPCVNGLPRMAASMAELAHLGRPEDNRPEGWEVSVSGSLPIEISRLAGLVSGRGACAHPDGTVRMVASTLRVFEGHVHAHLEGRCPR
jgi:NADH:ubiquinone oxidoreductase subunit F (NADH-binding)